MRTPIGAIVLLLAIASGTGGCATLDDRYEGAMHEAPPLNEGRLD